jgi:predicted DNA-binding protein
MIIGNTFFKRDAVLHARIPGQIKKAFQELAKEKGKTTSEYVLELVLNELHREEEGIFGPSASKTQNTNDHDK